MKRISFLVILIFITGIMFSCSDSSSSDTEEGYIDPGLSTKTIVNDKEYSITGTISDSCSAGSGDCGAVIYSGELNDTDYVGIAADNRDEANPPTFKFKMYWKASSIPTGTTTLPACTVLISDSSNSYSESGITGINVTITNMNDGTYTIVLNNVINVDTANITAGNLRAYKY